MPKIALIGAGSVVFTRNLVNDILTFPALQGSVIMAVISG
jgi:alpha-galactosidase